MSGEQLELLPSPDQDVIGKFSNPAVSGAPVTQRLAAVAAYPHTGTARRRVLDWIAQAGERGATDEEMQDMLRMNPSTQRPRRVELQEGGWIVDSKRTRLTHSRRDAVVWVLSERGRQQYAPKI